MSKSLLRFFPLFIVASAFAQAQAAEPPTEKASTFSVVVFLLLFFGAIIGYFVYLWWNQRKNPEAADPPAS